MSNFEDFNKKLEIVEVTEPSEPQEAASTSSGMSGGDRPSKRPGRRPGRKTSKMNVREKLERSRQSARECRARKKLRYQYLEDLVANREKAVFALRDELELYKQWCIKVDEGLMPLALLKLTNQQQASQSSAMSRVEHMETIDITSNSDDDDVIIIDDVIDVLNTVDDNIPSDQSNGSGSHAHKSGNSSISSSAIAEFVSNFNPNDYETEIEDEDSYKVSLGKGDNSQSENQLYSSGATGSSADLLSLKYAGSNQRSEKVYSSQNLKASENASYSKTTSETIPSLFSNSQMDVNVNSAENDIQVYQRVFRTSSKGSNSCLPTILEESED